MPKLKKLIWKGLLQIFPDQVCTSVLYGYAYLFFKGFKVIHYTDDSIDVFDTHIGTDYYIDKYGIERARDYMLVEDLEVLTDLNNKIYVEIDNIKDILSS